jgi:hypothetical protein
MYMEIFDRHFFRILVETRAGMLSTAAHVLDHALSSHGLAPIAKTREADGSIHFAIDLGAAGWCVVRWSEVVSARDYRTLRTMVRQGDFDRAVVVYSDCEQSRLSNEIESWPISKSNELARLLAQRAVT